MGATRRTKTSNTKKRTTSTRKRPSRSKSNKVYIPPYKAIILCLSVIVICLVLLLVSTLSKNSTTKSQTEASSITERFEKEEAKKPAATPAEKPSRAPAENSTEKSTEKPAATQAPAATPAPKLEPEQKPQVPSKPEQTQKPAQPKKKFNFEKAKNHAQLCFVFDDGGQNIDHLKKFLTLPFPITVAVLPQITHSVESANMVRNSGNELILHQPMQSINNSINPGPGAITPDMTDDQIIAQLFVNINQIAPIAGMNNHEGSGITADAEKMAVILQMASENGIYFLDSRTNVETQVPYVAKELGYTYFERNIFLDNEKTRENALSELKKGLALANKNGSVIMIGHIWSADFLPALLNEAYPELKELGYTFSTVSASKARKN